MNIPHSINKVGFLSMLVVAGLAINHAHATSLYWDPNGANTGSDGSGDWDSGTNWWDGAAAAAWTSGDDATIGSGGSAGTITLGAPTAANSVTFEAFSGTYTLNGSTLSTNSIDANTGSGQVYFNTMPVDGGASLITLGGTEGPSADRSIGNIKMKASVTGSAGLTKNGPGVLWWETNPAYTGPTTVNGGIYRLQQGPNNLPAGNVTLNGGQIGAYWNQTLDNRDLNVDFFVSGGESGFTQHGGATMNVQFKVNGVSDGVIKWGEAYFNPTVLDLMSSQSNTNAQVEFRNPIDLNGAQREIRVNANPLNGGGANAEFTDDFSNSSGTAAGITKTGGGLLWLNSANNDDSTYDGSLIINGGFVKFGSSYQNTWSGENLPNTANIDIQDGVVGGYFSLSETLGTAANEWQITGGTSGITMLQGDRVDITFNGGAELVWGSATFAPDVLVLNTTYGNQFVPSSVARLNNPLNLNGADRTVFTDSTAAAPNNGPNNGAFGPIIGKGGVLDGDIANTGSAAGLIKTGSGAIALNGTNTYDGGTTISEGSLYFAKIAAMPATGDVSVANGATLLVPIGGGGQWTTGTSGYGTLGGLLAGDGGQSPSTVTLSAAANLGLVVSGTQTYSGVVSSAGNVATYGDGTLVLDQNNTFTGDFIVDGGSTLVLSGDNSGASGNVSINNGYLDAAVANLPGGRLDFNSGGTDPAIWLASGTVTPTIGSGDDIYWNGSGGFAATSSALTVTPNAGAEIDWSAATGFRGQKLMLGSSVSTASVELTNNIDIDGSRTIRLFDNSATNDDVSILSGNIDGGGANRRLTVEGSGTLVLSGTNNLGTEILYLGNSGASSVVRATDGVGLPTAAKLYFNNGVLESSGSFTRNIGTGSGEVYWNNKGGFAANGGALTVNLEGGIALNWGDTNAGFRNQDPLYFGSDTADNVVTFENEIILNNTRNIQVTDNPDTDADYAVITGVISESGSRNLDKEGDGTLVLEAANTYTGTTSVNGGTLIINGSTSTGLVDVRNGSGRFLGGTGTIGGNVTLENNTGLTFDLITAPGSHDKLDVSGSFTFESASVLTITSSGGTPSTGTYTLVTAGSAPTGSVPATVNLPIDWTADAPQIVGNDLVINITSTGAASSPYDTWVNSFDWSGYTSPDLTVTGNPDGDSFNNLQEHAFGFDPTVSDGGGSLTISGGAITQNGPPQIYEDPGTGQYFLRYTRRADYVAAGLSYTAQFSPNDLGPGSFEDVAGGSVVGTGTGAAGESIEAVAIEFPDALPISGRKARFGQVEVGQMP